MKVKICGITRGSDAGLAVELGASALGFIFYPQSPRYIPPRQAARIISTLPAEILTVGVFVSPTLPELQEIQLQVRFSLAQIHGLHRPELREYGMQRLIYALPVDRNFSAAQLAPYREAYACLLDTRQEGLHGGSGRPFDWQVAHHLGKQAAIILAGGLTPENILKAIRIVQPQMIDVNSGVEIRPGIKSAAKLKQLFATLKEAHHV